MHIKTGIILVATIALLGLLVISCTPKNYDTFAKCLTSKNVTMYGAYWCPHCQEQKKDFGSSFAYVQYVECDSKGENGNPDLCTAVGIKGFPTWIIDGQHAEGTIPLDRLSVMTGCPLS